MTPHDPSRRRYLTILFSDLSDSTRLASQMEAEHYAAMIGSLRRVAEQVVPRHGGVIVRIQGDGVLAIFGHPETREDDARRAAEAALELHRQVRGLQDEGWPLPAGGLTLHSGLHSGLVLLQEGDLVLGRFELLGSAANIAARLAAAAEPDELLVGVQTLGPQAAYFQSGPPRELLLKGIAEPVTAVSVRGRASLASGTVARAGRAQGALVGRTAELALLAARLDEVLQGQSRFVALCGAPGLGKTRLAEAFLQQAAAAGHAVHRAGCPPERDVAPLHPLVQMLQQALPGDDLAAHLDALQPGLSGQVTPLLALLRPGTPAHSRPPALGVVLPALLATFVALAQQRPQVLFIDDWHWADDATRQVVGALHGLHLHRILIVVTARQLGGDDAAMSGAERVDLPPLDDAEADRAIAQLLPRADPFLAEAIRRHAGGNPLYIEELCHSAAADDLDRRLVRLHGGASWLSALIESRLARLPEAQAEVVRAAAVIGPVTPAWLLHQITGCDAAHPVWVALARQDFIYPAEDEGRWRFKHGITRDVIYESVGVHQRRALHDRIARALEERARQQGQEPAHEALAYHWAAALRTEAAARHAEAAGDRAVAVSALDRAKAQYRAALTALDAQLPGRAFYEAWARVSGKLALVCVFDASRAELPLFRRAVALAMDSGDAVAQARALYWLGYIAYAVGEPTQAIFQLELAQAAARHVRDQPLAVQVRATLGQAHVAAADYAQALPLLDEAIGTKRQHRSGQGRNVGLAFTLVCRAWALGDRGDFEAARHDIEEALALVGHLHHEIRASVQGWRCALLMWQGDWAQALAAGEDSTRIAESTRSFYQVCMGRTMTAYARWHLQPSPEVLQSLLDASAWLEPRDGSLFKSFNHGWAADMLVDSGRADEARQQARRALEQARHSDLLGAAMAARAMAVVAAREQRFVRAERCLALAQRVADRRQSPHETAVNQLVGGVIARHAGDLALARERLDRALPAFERMGMRWHLAQGQALATQL